MMCVCVGVRLCGCVWVCACVRACAVKETAVAEQNMDEGPMGILYKPLAQVRSEAKCSR